MNAVTRDQAHPLMGHWCNNNDARRRVRAGVALSIQPGRAVISGAALSACLAGIVTDAPLRFALWVHGDGTGGDLCAELRL
jgi:hypothetical protein